VIDLKAWAAKGGRARAEKMSPEQRRSAAQHAVRARWAKRKRVRQTWTGDPVTHTIAHGSASYTVATVLCASLTCQG